MSATVQRPDVVGYVAQVRAELDDLDGDVLEDLVGGLAADLADAAAESSQPLDVQLGSPAAYAAELRAAAGIPPCELRRLPAPRPEPEPEPRPVGDVLSTVQGHPWWPRVRDFLLVVRPVWWLMRAFIAVQLLGWFVGGQGIPHLVLLAVAAVVSIELGRGRWSERRGLAPFVLAGNILAVLAIPTLWPVGALFPDRDVTYVQADYPSGLSRDGEPVRNIFPYDAQGRLLSGVQLFDQDGRPLAVDASDSSEFATATATATADSQTPTRPVPALDAANQPAWYVFPLSEVPLRISDSTGEQQPFGTPTPAVPRALKVPAIHVAAGVSPTTSPTTAPTPTSATPSGSPTGSPVPTGSR